MSIFLFEGKDYKLWCSVTVCKGAWATTFNMLVFSYVFNVNIITVRNNTNGSIIDTLKSYFSHQNQHSFHTFGNPSKKISNGNHFAYLEPVHYLIFSLHINSIKNIGGKVELNDQAKTTIVVSLKDWSSNGNRNIKKQKKVIIQIRKHRKKTDTVTTSKEKNQTILDSWTITTDNTTNQKKLSHWLSSMNMNQSMLELISCLKKLLRSNQIIPVLIRMQRKLPFFSNGAATW